MQAEVAKLKAELRRTAEERDIRKNVDLINRRRNANDRNTHS
jgi:hypothetical protein